MRTFISDIIDYIRSIFARSNAAVVPDSSDPEPTQASHRDPDQQPLQLCEEAEHYRIGYEIGFYAKEEVAAWADRMILAGADLDPVLIDLSFSDSSLSFRLTEDLYGWTAWKDRPRRATARLAEELFTPLSA